MASRLPTDEQLVDVALEFLGELPTRSVLFEEDAEHRSRRVCVQLADHLRGKFNLPARLAMNAAQGIMEDLTDGK